MHRQLDPGDISSTDRRKPHCTEHNRKAFPCSCAMTLGASTAGSLPLWLSCPLPQDDKDSNSLCLRQRFSTLTAQKNYPSKPHLGLPQIMTSGMRLYRSFQDGTCMICRSRQTSNQHHRLRN